MIKVYDRKTKDYCVEKVAGGDLLKTLYTTRGGKIGLELLVKRKFYSWLTGALCDTKLSKRSISNFIKNFSINMDECSCKASEFNSFNDFFARKLVGEARPFENNPKTLLSPGDGRLQAWEDIDCKKILQIKGMTYSLSELLQSNEIAEQYEGGTYLLLRLCPVDYHRFHFFDDGICSVGTKVKGDYYSVNPIALNTIPSVFCRNKREYSIYKTENFGEALYIEVGATSVGSIVQTYTPDTKVNRGDEKGYFKFGGSTILLVFKKGTVIIDKEIVEQTRIGFETKVIAGEPIGESMI